MNFKPEYKVEIGGGLFYHYYAFVPYAVWSKDDTMPEMTTADRIAAFEAYEREYGPLTFYLEDEDSEDCDSYLWACLEGEKPGCESFHEVSLEDAVDWTERHLNADCDWIFEESITRKELRKAVKSFCENPYWRGVYEKAPRGAKRYLALQFVEGDDNGLAETAEQELDDKFNDVFEKMKIEDLEYLVAISRDQGSAGAMAIRHYEKRIAVLREREALKGVTVAKLLRELKKAYSDWTANCLDDDGYNAEAHRLSGWFERLVAQNLVSEAQQDRFLEAYSANTIAVND